MRPPRRFPLSRCGIILSLLAVLPGVTFAQSSNPPTQSAQSAQPAPAAQPQLPAKWNDAVRALAEKIASAAGSSRKISIELKNISSLDSSAASRIRLALDSELTARGFKTDAAGVHARVTLSEGAEGYIWIAEIQRSEGIQVAAVSLTRLTNSDARLRAAPMLQKRTVWEQPQPFLDFFERPMSSIPITVLSVLEPDRVTEYDTQAARGPQFSGAWPIPNSSASRDIRGRFVAPTNKTLKVFIASTVCDVLPFLYCVDSPGQEWPVGDGRSSYYELGRNYFKGLSADEVGTVAEKHPFFALSRLEYDHGSDWIQTELDGKARLYKFSTKSVAEYPSWGDDIASVRPGCGGSWQVLVTGTGDWNQTDHIQLYEISDDQPVPIGQRLEFPGPILAMWSAEDKKSARVVSRNLQTGMYEASIVSVSCSD